MCISAGYVSGLQLSSATFHIIICFFSLDTLSSRRSFLNCWVQHDNVYTLSVCALVLRLQSLYLPLLVLLCTSAALCSYQG